MGASHKRVQGNSFVQTDYSSVIPILLLRRNKVHHNTCYQREESLVIQYMCSTRTLVRGNKFFQTEYTSATWILVVHTIVEFFRKMVMTLLTLEYDVTEHFFGGRGSSLNLIQ